MLKDIRLCWYILITQRYKRILDRRDEKLRKHFLKKAEEEQLEKKLCGVGTTKGYRAYEKLSSSNKYLTTWEIIKLLKTL